MKCLVAGSKIRLTSSMALWDSMKDHCVWISARISSSAFCHQHSLQRRGTIKGCAREICDSLRDKDLHLDQDGWNAAELLEGQS